MLTIALITAGFLGLAGGSLLGYYARQSIVKKRKGTIEGKLQRKISQTKEQVAEMMNEARQKAAELASSAQKEREERRKELLKTEQLLYKREDVLDKRFSNLEEKEKQFEDRVNKLKTAKEKIETLQQKAEEKLEKAANMSAKQAKEAMFKLMEERHEHDLMGRLRKLRQEGEERYQGLAKEMITAAVQRYALSQAQEITTTTVRIPSDEIKGRIIGKEGRNIKTLEKAAGVEVVVDDTPETVLISGYNPLRRYVAKVALERLIKDGRIQPTRIEEQVEKAEEDVNEQIKEFGEKAVFDTNVLGLPPKLIALLGRLYFRTSYGQNVLLHSIEVAHLASALAQELGADYKTAKKAGLLHDIGKAVDHQIEGSHTDIGIKILEKFGQEPKVIEAMKAHHEEYEPTSLEAVLVKVADQISGARPGARKDTVENYLKRLKELEDLALSFKGVINAYAIAAGREVRVFVKPEQIGDLESYKLARDIADRVQRELSYPGEIKVNLIRETRVIEYAK